MSEAADPPVVGLDPRALADRVLALATGGRRTTVGIAGPPGTGKSTLAAQVIAALPAGTRVAVVPMDGYHLSNRVLRDLDRSSRKGAIDTFDATGFAVLLERLRLRDGDTVYAPDFDHAAGEPVSASIAIQDDIDIVITEGNYLLADTGPWRRARAAMDEVWYLRTPQRTRLERLVARHIATGKSPEAAVAWANGTDEDNARVIAPTAPHADLIVDAG